jgi:hypothetical protein
MAGINLDIETGQIDKGDTKTFTVFADDNQGNRLKLDSITLEINADGTKTTLTKSDFSVSDKIYTTKHTFQNGGLLTVEVSVTDDANLDSERENASIYVNS